VDLFHSSGAENETPILLGPSETANINHWTNHVEVEVILQLTVGQSVSQYVLVLSPLWGL
jgi:hypothetical protein